MKRETQKQITKSILALILAVVGFMLLPYGAILVFIAGAIANDVDNAMNRLKDF